MSEQSMRLGAFSVSLTVKDLSASRAFYEKLGFTAFHGVAEQGWLIMRNEGATIGLFEGMFERNMLTFNPGWDADAQPIEDFTDVRELQRDLDARGLTIQTRTDAAATGPAHILLVDPDGNPILLDQHV
jgi:catechol 2,3-dioxygenase-like lactoylglutathione lyase family enzyme